MSALVYGSFRSIVPLLLFSAVVVVGTATLLRTRLFHAVDTACLAATIMVVGAIYGVTELLGSAHMFVRSWIAVMALAALAVGGVTIVCDPQLRQRFVATLKSSTRLARRQWLWMFLNLLGLLMVLLYAPSNYDALAFHLPRAAMWLQEGSLDHFATHFIPQLDRPPVAEVLTAWARGLSGTWDSAPLVQWVSAVVLALSIRACLARLLGPLDRLEEATCLVAIGLSPMIIAQSTTPQVDLVSVALVAAAAAIMIECVSERRPLLLPVAALGFGLALATKGTAVVGVAAVLAGCVPFVWKHLRAKERNVRSSTRRNVLVGVGVCALCLVALFGPIAPTFSRNAGTFGTIAGPEQGALVVTTNNPRLVLANSLRQFGPNLQYGGFSGPSAVPSRIQIDLLEGLATIVGGEEATSSRDINHPSADPWGENSRRTIGYQEDVAGSPLVYNLALISLVILALTWRRLAASERSVILAVMLAAGSAAVVSGKVVKLQYWGNRLTLPVTVATLIMALVILVATSRRLRFGNTMLVAVVFVATLTWLGAALVGPSRPLIAHDFPIASHRIGIDGYDRYFHDRKGIGADYQALEDYLKRSGCSDVALGSFVVYELPLHVVAERTGSTIRSVETPTESPTPDNASRPCVVVRENKADGPSSDVPMPFGYLAVEIVD